MSTWTEGPSNDVRRNQGRRQPSAYANQGRSDIARIPRRSILKNTNHWNTPSQRRLVHFMPERWQQPAINNINMTSPEYRGRLATTTPVQVTNQGPHHTYSSVQRHERSKKTPEKAHLDTLRRRERRQNNRAVLFDNVTELGRLSNNRFNLLSETEEEKTDDDNDDYSEADNDTQAMKKNKQQKHLSKQRKPNTDTHNNGVSKYRQANTTTEVPVRSEHVVGNKTKTRENNQRQIHVSIPEIEQDFIA